MPIQRDAVLRPTPLIAVPGGGRRRWLPLFLAAAAATGALGFSGTVAPTASAAADRVLLRDATTSVVERADRAGRRAPKGPDAMSPDARWAIPLLTPDPAKLRQAKARAASRSSSGAGPSPQAVAPLPHTAVFNGLNKPGMFANEFSGTPPDTTGAIGPSHYVELVNSIGITAYDRNLNALAGPVALEDFIGFPSDFVFDPQIQWDDNWGRWVYVMDDIEGPEDNYLAFGWSKTADPTNLSTGPGGGWCGYFLYTEELLDDYPKLGHSNSGITIGTNVFDLEAETFLGSRIWSIAKPANPQTCPGFGEAGLTIGATGALLTEDGDLVFTPVPANTADSSANSYVVAADYPIGGDAQIMGWHMSGAGAGATLFEDGNMEVSPFEFPAFVPQPGTAEVLDSLDTRLTNAVAVTDPAVGDEAVWTQHTVDGPGGRSVVRWYELLPGTQTVRQEGTISDPSHFVFNGAISPTAQGDAAAIDFNRGSSTLFPDMHAQSRDVSTPLGQMGNDVLLGTSAGPAVDFSCDIAEGEACRWGDYAGASPDPSVAGVVWGSNQGLAAPSGEDPRWTTRNFALVADETAPPAPQITDTDPDSQANDNNPEVKGNAEVAVSPISHDSTDVPKAIPDLGTANSTLTISGVGTVSDIDVQIDSLQHTFDEDLRIELVAPDATTVVLSNRRGGSGNNFTNTLFDDGAATAISLGSAPFTGSFRPDGQLSTLNGKPVEGTWTLQVKDEATGDSGTLQDWGIEIDVAGAGAYSTVKLYETADCSGAIEAQGAATAFNSPGLTATVANDAATQFSATATDAAGNTSACSAPFVYIEDSTAPPAPQITDTVPDSPANDNNPAVKGSAETGSTIRLYRAPTQADCSPANLLATGEAAQFESLGLTASVADNTTTSFRATATDQAGNASGCSVNSISYTESTPSTTPPPSGDPSPPPPPPNHTTTPPGTSKKCVVAKAKVKRAKRKLQRAETASVKKKTKKQLKRAKRRERAVC